MCGGSKPDSKSRRQSILSFTKLTTLTDTVKGRWRKVAYSYGQETLCPGTEPFRDL